MGWENVMWDCSPMLAFLKTYSAKLKTFKTYSRVKEK